HRRSQGDLPVVVARSLMFNAVTNPAARHDTASPIHGMPILDVDRARTVMVIRMAARSCSYRDTDRRGRRGPLRRATRHSGERVLGGVLLADHRVDARLALHGAGDGLLGGAVVVVVDLLVV